MSNVSHMLFASVTTRPLGSYVQVRALLPTRGHSVAVPALPPSPRMLATATALAIGGRIRTVAPLSFCNERAKLRLMLAVYQVSSRWHMANPSIEGTFKRLRLLPAPHVKR
jgi:hypothetical protein